MRATRFRLMVGIAIASPFARGATAPATPPANPLANQKVAILTHLNAVVNWHRQVQAGAKWVTEPAEAFFLSTERDFADRAVKAAFAGAQAETSSVGDSGGSQSTAAQSQRVSSALSVAQARADKLQAQKSALDTQAQDPAAAAHVAAQRDVVAAQLQLARTRLDALQKMAGFYSGAGDEAAVGSLAGQIRALQRSLPELFASESGAPAPAAAVPAPASLPAAPAGLLGRAEAVYSLESSRRSLDRLIAQTTGLQLAATRLREPVRTAVTAVLLRSEQAALQNADSTDQAQLAGLRDQVEGWTAQYRTYSAILLPYSQEASLLGQAADNLREWHASIDRQYDAVLQSLAIQILLLGGALVLLLIVSEVWRRGTFRYVQDARRRRQFLLVRRFVTGGLIAVVLVVNVVSDLGYLATFAGFITAGVAVALQSVILSVAAYFFLIGRYGVKVGDRVTLSGVTGQVIDIGLVRVYLMELAGTGVDLHPTGRVVVFANSALFSGTNPLYKQIPGTDYTWHELHAELTADADVEQVRLALLGAVQSVYDEYRGSLEQQHTSVEQLIDLRLDVPVPKAAVRFAETGVEIVVRYPLEISTASEIDARLAQRVLAVLAAQTQLKGWINGAPKLRAAVKV